VGVPLFEMSRQRPEANPALGQGNVSAGKLKASSAAMARRVIRTRLDSALCAVKRRIMVAAHKVDTLAHFLANGKSAKDGLCKS